MPPKKTPKTTAKKPRTTKPRSTDKPISAHDLMVMLRQEGAVLAHK